MKKLLLLSISMGFSGAYSMYWDNSIKQSKPSISYCYDPFANTITATVSESSEWGQSFKIMKKDIATNQFSLNEQHMTGTHFYTTNHTSVSERLLKGSIDEALRSFNLEN